MKTLSKYFPASVHSAAVLVINVIGYWLATEWSLWTHDRHPSVAAAPVVAASSVLGFLCWYHTANALIANQWQLSEFRSWGRLFGLSLIAGAILYSVMPEFLTGYPFSLRRLVAFAVYQAVSNALIISVAAPQRSLNSAALLRKLLKRGWFKGVVLLTTALAAACLLIGVVELVFFALNSTRSPGPVKVYEGEYLTSEFSDYDPRLGKKLIPNADAVCRLKVDDSVVWDVRYTTDEFGRRTTTHPEGSSSSHFAVFFGCSFLFGEGANDNETIPSQFAAAAPQYRAYNYGVPGYGTQHMLAKLESGSLRNEVKESKGVIIYLYLEDVHEPRVIGSMQETNSFGLHFPYYDLRDDGKVQLLGDFATGRPVLTNMYGLLGRSQTVRYLGLNFPKRTERHIEIVARLIEQSKVKCRQQLGCDDFYVACFPKLNPHRRLIPLLESRNIKILDYSELFDPAAEGLFHKGDGHPTPLANHSVAQKLTEDIPDNPKAAN